MNMVGRRPLLAAASSALARPATAQAQPLRIIVPFAPGGSTDVAARLVAPALADALARSVVIENRGGAGGVIGTEAVVGAPADGSGVGFFTVSAAVRNAILHRKLAFETRRAVAAGSLVGTMPMLLVVGPHVPARSLAKLLDLLRRSPRPLTYGSAGPGSINHLARHLLAMRARGRARGRNTPPIAAPGWSFRT